MKTYTNQFGAFQGDVSIIRLDSIPKDAKQTDQRTVAYGESTGHHHTVAGPVSAYKSLDGFVFVVKEDETEPVQLIHQTHNPITFTPGIWLVPFITQVEYDVRDERKVID